MSGVEFFVPGVPVPRPRQKFTFRGGKCRTYTGDKRVVAWKQKIMAFALPQQPAKPHDCPVLLDLVCFMPPPKSAVGCVWGGSHLKRRWADKKPDWDNLEKAIADALKDAGYVKDDGRFVAGERAKVYADLGQATGVWVRATPIEHSMEPKLVLECWPLAVRASIRAFGAMAAASA